jgi:hypothetical protein
MIVETTSNQLYKVEPAEGIDHAWLGVEVKRVRGGGYAPKAKAQPILVRKAGSKVIDGIAPTNAGVAEERRGIFRDHTCYRCKDGERPCVRGNPGNCSFPHARND